MMKAARCWSERDHRRGKDNMAQLMEQGEARGGVHSAGALGRTLKGQGEEEGAVVAVAAGSRRKLG